MMFKTNEDAIRIGNRSFLRNGKTYVMGILNVTPDSFSDGGRYDTPDRAYFRVEQMIAEGADLIDLGGESTRPGYAPVDARTECSRVLPVLEGVKARFDIPVSLDTSKAEVARAGLTAGADMINDVRALSDPGIARAAREVPVCLMHNALEPCMGEIVENVVGSLGRSVENAVRAGLKKEQLIVDPGIGFAKNTKQNLDLIRRIAEFKRLGCPVLLGVSNKRVIGDTLGLPVGERTEGTAAVTVWAVTQGVQFIRVHDVRTNVRAVKMTEEILGEGV